MVEVNLIDLFCVPLAKTGIDYMITGAVASILYGHPRLTHDIDLVISLRKEQAALIPQAFSSEEFYCPPVEVIRIEIGREITSHLNVIHPASGLKADIYPLGRDQLHLWAFPLRRQMEYRKRMVWVAPPEYVILRKLLYYREGGSDKHLTDIRGMLDISGELIDKAILEQKIGEYGLTTQWEKANNL